MGSSALRPRLNDEHRGHRPTGAAGDAHDDVEARRTEPADGSARGLRRRWRHYSGGSKFSGTLLPHATSTAALTRGIGVVGAALDGPPLAIVRRLLEPPSSSRATRIGAVGMAPVAGVADEEDGVAVAASLADDVKYWTVAGAAATRGSRLCCVLMTQTTARGPVAAGPLPFLLPWSPTGPTTARFTPRPSKRFGFQPPLTLSARTLSTRASCSPSVEGRGNVGEKRNGPGDRSPRPLLKSAGSRFRDPA